ncbi:MAG: hypothetical protein ACP5OG_01080 [Candidatus Nanoarchaeia archaeon]
MVCTQKNYNELMKLYNNEFTKEFSDKINDCMYKQLYSFGNLLKSKGTPLYLISDSLDALKLSFHSQEHNNPSQKSVLEKMLFVADKISLEIGS